LFPAASPKTALLDNSQASSRVDQAAAVIIVLAYAGLQTLLAIGHQPWRDEAQAWLWAGALSQPFEFFVIPGEGHPPLWFWLLRALSLLTDFSHARYFTLVVAIINALLLARLLGRNILLLFIMLAGQAVLSYWGYHFRPYGLVLTAILATLLLDRAGRHVAATWALALACGLHFFAGLLFAFWLLVQLQRGLPLRHLVGPSVVAALFGLSAVLSGLGNTSAGHGIQNLWTNVFYALAWPVPWPQFRTWPVALITMCLLTFGLWRHRFVLICMLVLMLAFALGTAAIYGQSPWHSAFMLMLVFVSFIVTREQRRLWVLVMLLAPNAVAGISSTRIRLADPAWTKQDLYLTILGDAGPSFDPATQLVAWQDFNLSTTAAVHGISYISGNNGKTLGPIDWRDRREGAISNTVTEIPTPYWMVCAQCELVLEKIQAAGRIATELATETNADDGDISAFRIDGPN
jgi:hypothetical protein